MQAPVYNTQGKSAGKVDLPESVFGLAWNADLVHDVVLAMRSNARAGTAHTKIRGEVRGGGKKPWRQKGTGRARHGSRRSPIWVGGGVALGPRSEKSYARKLNRKVRAKALGVALSQKLRDDEVIFLDTFAYGAPAAKDAKAVLGALATIPGKETLATKRANAALVVLSERDENAEKSFRNFGNVLVQQAKDINPVLLLTYKYVIVANPADTVAQIAARFGETQVVVAEAPAKKVAKKAPAKKATKKVAKKTTA